MKAPIVLIAAIGLLAIPCFASGMDLGTNFWNLNWHRPNDCFDNVKNVAGENPWNPEFLKEISIFHVLRFMDWDVTNNSERATWSERPLRTAPKQNPVAYEWMIDLCNRNNADMWVCIPAKAITHDQGNEPSDYALRLCILAKTGVDMKTVPLKPLFDRLSTMTPEQFVAAGGVRTGAPLKPELRLYIEYSNETWNGQFKQSHYCCGEGAALELDPKKTLGNGEQWTAGFRYHAWAALRAFRAADLVFGDDSKRTIKVLASQVGNVFIPKQHLTVLADPTWNPWKTKATAIAIAPYFGHKVDGADPQAAQKLREDIAATSAKCAKVKAAADEAGLLLVSYEGGQHVLSQANLINRNPVMHDLYTEYLTEMSKYFTTFVHYAHVGKSGEKGAWGALEFTGQPPAEAPKYRALLEWSQTHPRPTEGAK